MSGVLVINPIKAKLNVNHEILGKQDPYCVFHLGGQQLKTRVCKNGGKRPSWDDSILLKRKFEPIVYIEIKDKDFFSDDLIGVSQIDLNKIPAKKAHSQWYPIFNKKKPAGEVLIEVIYTPDEPLTPSVQTNNKAANTNTQEVEIIDPLKKSTYLAKHIIPIVNSVDPSLHIDDQIKPLYPTFEKQNSNSQPEIQQPNGQPINGQSPSHQQLSTQQQPGYQQPRPQPQSVVQQPGSQQPGFQQQPNYQQPSYQQPGYQQPQYQQFDHQQNGYQRQSSGQQYNYQQQGYPQQYQQPGCGQPNFNQRGVWQPNVQQPGVWQPNVQQPGVWQPNNGQCYPIQPNLYNQNAQHQMP